REGFASGAAAGLLAPSIGSLAAPVKRFFDASLDRFPAYLEPLQEIDAGLRLLRGLLQVVDDSTPLSEHSVLSAAELTALEPRLHAPLGAILHRRDAALDNVRLVDALRCAVERQSSTRYLHVDVTRIDVNGSGVGVHLSNGTTVQAGWVVLSAGGWTPQIQGIPRRLPVSPLKGQMLAVASSALQHPVTGNEIYLVPRGAEIVIGATVEHAGFDLSTSDEAIDGLRDAAIRLVPELAKAPVTRRWAGIRPATPDMLPIIGSEPSAPRLLYACGHSKNGILLAPATAAAIAGLVSGAPSEFDLSPFAAARFDGHS
ncbi:MAG TPA: FAD-dependent oxidoreductase, partial [Gemmatimonadaceae bacterium]